MNKMRISTEQQKLKKKNQIIELNNTINGKIFSLNGLNGRLDQAEERIS